MLNYIFFIHKDEINFSLSTFVSLVAIPIGIAISEEGLKICGITAGIKKPIIKRKKKKKKHDNIVLLAKTKLNSIEVLISGALIDSYISYDEFVLVKNVFKIIQ